MLCLKLLFAIVGLYSIVVFSFGIYNNSGTIAFKALLFASKNIDIEPPELFGKIDGIQYSSSAGKAYIVRDYNSSGQDVLKFEDFVLNIDYPTNKAVIKSKVSLLNIESKTVDLQEEIFIKYGTDTNANLKDLQIDILTNSIWSNSVLVIDSSSYKITVSGFYKKADVVDIKGPFKAVFKWVQFYAKKNLCFIIICSLFSV